MRISDWSSDVCSSDLPSGRGLKLTPSPVKQAAQAAGIPVCQPRSLRLDGKYPEDASIARQALLDAAPDLMVVAAYGLLLRSEERRVGKECVSTCRSRWSTDH